MNYLKIYNQLITKRVSEPYPKDTPGGREKHHILPKSMGGKNIKSNLVYLSTREHFVAHMLLAKIYPDSGMPHAAWLMACFLRGRGMVRINSRTYGTLRKDHANRISSNKAKGKATSDKLKGRRQSEEHIAARTKARSKNGPWHSKETASKISESNKKAFREGRVNPLKNLKYSQEVHAKGVATRKINGSYAISEITKEKMKNASRKPPPPKSQKQIDKLRLDYQNKIICPHCGKEGSKLPMGRWHFNNCKLKVKD